ncbi:unnamed protein product [Protopolystoma xenopodis]|uniref:Uncharacterized protein n=1 Tax=Protopolystoma xenopodis TaxID=117903 RepID=A0A3S5CN53_9PLAT|nr:unnamed protein product [Protopolystoma xenopodis]
MHPRGLDRAISFRLRSGYASVSQATSAAWDDKPEPGQLDPMLARLKPLLLVPRLVLATAHRHGERRALGLAVAAARPNNATVIGLTAGRRHVRRSDERPLQTDRRHANDEQGGRVVRGAGCGTERQQRGRFGRAEKRSSEQAGASEFASDPVDSTASKAAGL